MATHIKTPREVIAWTGSIFPGTATQPERLLLAWVSAIGDEVGNLSVLVCVSKSFDKNDADGFGTGVAVSPLLFVIPDVVGRISGMQRLGELPL